MLPYTNMWPFSTTKAPKESNAPIFFTNTLSGKKEVFAPIAPGFVTMYSCGPTVYSKQHIGNLKAPLFADLVARVLCSAGYRVRRVINITDVGHLVGDGDEGEDKMIVGSVRENKSAKDIAAQYTKMFQDDLRSLNLDTNEILFPFATQYIQEQIAMISALDKKGVTYRTRDGIYFDTSMFPRYGMFGQKHDRMRKEVALSDMVHRITQNVEKRNPADFALWKFSPAGVVRQQEWQSPWGRGFPGWHIECSAMVRALLGITIDIHTGGMDHIPVHHTNEIAQSETANGKPLARYWMHEAFVTLADEKISKSVGNDIYLSDIVARGFHPLALRYFFLQSHYRNPISFTWDALGASAEALSRLWRVARELKVESKGMPAGSEIRDRVITFLRDDLSTPQALALLWETIRDEDLSPKVRWGVLAAADEVLGLCLTEPPRDSAVASVSVHDLPEELQKILTERNAARAAGDYARADALRIHIQDWGYAVDDGPSGQTIRAL